MKIAKFMLSQFFIDRGIVPSDISPIYNGDNTMGFYIEFKTTGAITTIRARFNKNKCFRIADIRRIESDGNARASMKFYLHRDKGKRFTFNNKKIQTPEQLEELMQTPAMLELSGMGIVFDLFSNDSHIVGWEELYDIVEELKT